MATTFKFTFVITMLTIAVLFGSMHPCLAGTLTDPTLVTGSNAIDPPNAVQVNLTATDATPKETLTALTGFGAVQTFGNFTAGTNVISFTDANRADVQFTYTGDVAANIGEELVNAAFVTSASSGVRLQSSNPTSAPTAHSFTVTIDFGDWNGSVFDGAGQATQAAGFTIASTDTRWERVETISVDFLDSSGGSLLTSAQTISPDASTTAAYFGYEADAGNAIGSIVINVDIKSITESSTTSPVFGLDDFGFTSNPVPEPGSLSLLVASLLLIHPRRQSR